MKTRFLFPNYWRLIGIFFIAAHLILGIMMKVLHPGGFSKDINQPEPTAMLLHNDINILLVVLGLFFIAFAKEKLEDEQISQLRLDSLQWAIYANYAIFVLCVILFNGINFVDIVAYNVITPLIIFILRFRWKIYLLNRSLNKSE